MSDNLSPQTLKPKLARQLTESRLLPVDIRESWKCAINYNKTENVSLMLEGEHGDLLLDIEWISSLENHKAGYGIHHASGRNNIGVERILLKHRPTDVNKRSACSRTPLHWASQCHVGNLETIKYLLKKGADINAQDEDGCTALYYATYANNIRLVELLLNNNADITIQTRRNHESALDLAAKQRNEDMINAFRNKCNTLTQFTSLILESKEQCFEKERARFIAKKDESVQNVLQKSEIQKNNYEKRLQQEIDAHEKVKKELYVLRANAVKNQRDKPLPTQQANISVSSTEKDVKQEEVKFSAEIIQPASKDKNRNVSTQCDDPLHDVTELLKSVATETIQKQLLQIRDDCSLEIQTLKDCFHGTEVRLSKLERTPAEIQKLKDGIRGTEVRLDELEQTSPEMKTLTECVHGIDVRLSKFERTSPEMKTLTECVHGIDVRLSKFERTSSEIQPLTDHTAEALRALRSELEQLNNNVQAVREVMEFGPAADRRSTVATYQGSDTDRIISGSSSSGSVDSDSRAPGTWDSSRRHSVSSIHKNLNTDAQETSPAGPHIQQDDTDNTETKYQTPSIPRTVMEMEDAVLRHAASNRSITDSSSSGSPASTDALESSDSSSSASPPPNSSTESKVVPSPNGSLELISYPWLNGSRLPSGPPVSDDSPESNSSPELSGSLASNGSLEPIGNRSLYLSLESSGNVSPNGSPESNASLESSGFVLLHGSLESSGSVSPTGSLESSGSVSPNGSVESSGTVSPNGSLESSGSVLPNGSVESSGTVSPNNSLESSDTVSPNGCMESSDTVSPNSSVESSDTVSPNGSLESSDTVSPNGSVESSGTVSPNGSLESSGSVSPNGSPE